MAEVARRELRLLAPFGRSAVEAQFALLAPFGRSAVEGEFARSAFHS
jgi:hypothetical protein